MNRPARTSSLLAGPDWDLPREPVSAMLTHGRSRTYVLKATSSVSAVSGYSGDLYSVCHSLSLRFLDVSHLSSRGEGNDYLFRCWRQLDDERNFLHLRIHRGYFGAAFFDDKQSQLGGHVAVQENGGQDIMINTPPSGGSVRLSPGSCSLWDVSMLETGSTRFHPVIMGGHARFRCDFVNPEAHMNGNVDFRFCM